MRTRIESAVALVLPVLIAVCILSACSKQGPGVAGSNIPPETTLSFASDHSDTMTARVHLQWAGIDRDGEVVGYEARWDTLDWFAVSVTDSVFLLEVGGGRDTLGAYQHYTFSVRSIDNDGEVDPTPATLSFTSRNAYPETEIVHGPASVSAPMICLAWRGWDYDGVVVGYGYRLYKHEGGEWIEVAGEDSLPPDEFEIQFGPLAGLHRFDVWSIDDLGDIDPTPAEREFTCDPEFGNPLLAVRSNVLGTARFRGGELPNWAHEPLDVFEGEDIVFDWHAVDEEASTCPPQGFSYAYDDTSTWGQSYSLDDTHFEVAPEAGEHALYVAALGSGGLVTRGRVSFEVVPAAMNDYILVVDDYDYRENLPDWGTDGARDAFYDTLTTGYARPAFQWDPAEHMVGGVPQPPDVTTLAGASTVVWYVDHDETALSGVFDLLDPHRPYYSRLDGYVRAGGNLILCGFKPLGAITGEDQYPMQFTASDTAPGRVFVRDRLRIGEVDNSGFAYNIAAPWNYGFCFHGAVPGGTGIPEDRTVQLEAMYIDSVGAGGYPEPGKWPYYADPPEYAPGLLHCGLPAVDAYRPCSASPIETHGIDAFLNYNFQGQTCVMLSPTGGDRGNVCALGFPLYYLQTAQVKAVFDELLPMMGEQRM
jgi:hypothetical protein